MSPKSDFSSKANVGRPWDHQDLIFLKDALAREMSYAQIAGFLDRGEEEVRAKVEMSNPRK